MSKQAQKRSYADHLQEPSDVRQNKKPRLWRTDRFSPLSDEILIRILGFLSVPHLVQCQRLSRRFYKLCDDSQLWKAAYYQQWVRPRALRLPGPRRPGALDASSKTAAWLNEQDLVSKGTQTNWQRQYRLRHNWSRGDCSVREVRIAEQQPCPRTLVQVHGALVLTAERSQGLRIWHVDEASSELRSNYAWDTEIANEIAPTALAVTSGYRDLCSLLIVAGFSDGLLRFLQSSADGRNVEAIFSSRPAERESVAAMAISYPFLATLTSTNVLCLYSLVSLSGSDTTKSELQLLTMLRSGSIWPPASLSLRVDATINLSIAYALPQYLSGWSVGLQEVRIARDGTLQRTRTANANEQAFTTIPAPSRGSRSEPQAGTCAATRPTSLSLSHPYILTAHADNTLTLYMVRTTHDQLSIGRGRKLWGHTSSVRAVHVGPRGKAISVGGQGDDIRVWNLEGGEQHVSKTSHLDRTSVQIRASPQPREARLRTADYASTTVENSRIGNSNTSSDAWIGFDDERVLVLRETDSGSEALMIYDFS